jgi:hypothetical protein
MSPEQRDFLMLRMITGICGFLEASWILRIPVDALVFLEKVGHLKALANPPPGAQRYFLISYLLRIAQDEQWMAKAVRLIREHYRRRNEARKKVSNRNQQRASFDFSARSKRNKQQL